MSLDMDYIDVATRIVEFREKYPEGSLQPADPAAPYRIETLGGQTFIVVVAAAYRTADDTRPGIGMAYEQFPGKSNFTRGSELQNAETSAWGRAIVAALAADTKRGIASAEEVRNRREEQKPANRNRETPPEVHASDVRGQIARWAKENGMTIEAVSEQYLRRSEGVSIGDETNVAALTVFFADLQKAMAGEAA
jgi:1,2-phenylacetyl-CoA epoxidase PaaB subunit